MTRTRIKTSVRLPADIALQLADYARSRRRTQTDVIEAALSSFLSPDGAERTEAALSRRLDRIVRQLERLEWHHDLTNETLALFIRFWLTTNPPLPDTAMKAAQSMGKERWERFVDTLSRRMESDQKLASEIGEDR